MKHKGIFIAFEGIDGSGKSTQVERLSQKLRDHSVPVHSTAEPTNGPIGSMIRHSFTHRTSFDDRVIAALFVADRLDHLTNNFDGILGLIDSGITVITDRYYLSSFAYHSSDVDSTWLAAANSISTNLLLPDITIFIDIDPVDSLARISNNRTRADRFEVLPKLFDARKNYLKAIELLDDSSIISVSGKLAEDELSAVIWAQVEPLIRSLGGG